MPGIYAGDTKCLVFPVMCDGYLKLPYYDKNSPDTELDLRGGLWGHQGKFSIEAILSPYDVNGFGTKAGASGIGYATSERTPPSLDQTHPTNVNDEHYQSEKYFSHVERKTHKMYLFSNPNFSLYLENTTLNNFNQPAEYKIVAAVGGTPVSSDAVIKAHNTLYGKYDINGLYEGSTTSLTELDNLTFLSTEGGVTITCDSTATIGTGTEIFNSNGISLGLATVLNATQFTLTSATNWTNALYVSQPKEALYMETLYKVGFSYSTTGAVSIYLNNKLIKTGTVTPKTFEAANCYIGQKVNQTWSSGYGSGPLPNETSNEGTQFMGELYEICMYKRTEPTFSIHTLSPGYNDIIFYYRFGDE